MGIERMNRVECFDEGSLGYDKVKNIIIDESIELFENAFVSVVKDSVGRNHEIVIICDYEIEEGIYLIPLEILHDKYCEEGVLSHIYDEFFNKDAFTITDARMIECVKKIEKERGRKCINLKLDTQRR